jgi:hypothetical protein
MGHCASEPAQPSPTKQAPAASQQRRRDAAPTTRQQVGSRAPDHGRAGSGWPSVNWHLPRTSPAPPAIRRRGLWPGHHEGTGRPRPAPGVQLVA